MSTIDSYEVVDEPRRHRSHRHRDPRDDREPRYVDKQDTYYSRDLVRRPTREDSDLSVEEVRREFPPPGSAAYAQRRYDRYDPPYRSRSVERGAYLGDPRRSYNELDNRRRDVVEEEVVKRRRSLSRNQKILAAAGGAAIAVGAKELWDRREAHGGPVHRNALGSAAAGAAGAFAAYEGAEYYAKHGKKSEDKEKKKTYIAHRGRDGEIDEYYSSDDESVKPKQSKSRRKSIVDSALGLAGLGAAAKAASGGRSRRGSDDSHESGRRSRGRDESPKGTAKFQQAAKAALLAGAAEAFRVRNEPGGWGGEKGKRIITAAIGAGGIDAAADRDPDHKSKRHILEAVVGGLAGNRLINGSRNAVSEDGRSGRGRSRSRSRSRGPGGSGGLAAIATAGLGALAGKKLLDRSRSRSRGGSDRRRRDSRDSYDSRSPSPPRQDHRRRSKSVTDYARKGLAALGIGETAAHENDKHRRDDRSRRSASVADDDDYASRRSRRHGSSRADPYDDHGYDDARSQPSARRRDGQRNRRVAEGKEDPSDSESSLGSSSGDEKRIKKMKGKQLLTAGLASIATIHAAHSIYQSMEKRAARRKAVEEGEMTPEEAKKLKAKATLQDAASVGIAALGIKGAISEIKEANEMRRECREFREKKEERHQKRLERQKGIANKNNASDTRLQTYRPRYVDDNPYSAHLPAPPVGYDRR
ncbi:hypothetical protein B7463_g6324, partial [Scytalidium lignicola]